MMGLGCQTSAADCRPAADMLPHRFADKRPISRRIWVVNLIQRHLKVFASSMKGIAHPPRDLWAAPMPGEASLRPPEPTRAVPATLLWTLYSCILTILQA